MFNNNYHIFFKLMLLLLTAPLFGMDEEKKIELVNDLRIIKHHIETGYAPALWKNQYNGWDLEGTFKSLKKEILSSETLSTKQFHKIVRKFMLSMQDYHVDVIFFSTEKSQLPFSVKGIEERYFIDWIDAKRLSSNFFDINIGDELIEFDNRPIAHVIEELAEFTSRHANPKTDASLAQQKLTMRLGAAGDIVPKGSIQITTRSAKDGNLLTHQLRWVYTPEMIKPHLDSINLFSSWWPFQLKQQWSDPFYHLKMANPLHEVIVSENNGRDGALGSKKSFLPPFGEKIWDSEKEEKLIDISDFWHAYIYLHPKGHPIGYIRIPHYLFDNDQADEFGKIIKFMEDKTDALIIDQVHNMGGFIQMVYQISSMLTDRPLNAPYHRIKLTQKEVLDAYRTLERIKWIEFAVDTMGINNVNDQNAEGNFQELLFMKAYCENLLREWNEGNYLTSPIPIGGVDQINPHSKYRYTKPILMLINEMDFSGGDFMPAIMQDNQRAVLFGTRTAGAGGFVYQFEFPNQHGIATCSYTASIAERMNSDKIEDLGIDPDIQYELSLEDLDSGFQKYIDKANDSIDRLIVGTTEET